MKLTQINALNFKGQSFTENLASLNFLIGSNFAGKTARTDAIRLLLLGYLPELGKPAKATFGLASGTVLEVSGKFDNGMTILRRWTAKGNSIKTEEEIPAELEKLGDLAVMLNAEEYFALGDRARVQYVARQVNLGSTYTREKIMERLFAKLEEAKIAPEPGKLLNIPLLGCTGPDIQTVVEGMLAATASSKKTAKDYADRMEGTVQGLASLRAQDAQQRPVSAIAADTTAARDSLATLQQDKGKLTAEHTAMLGARTRRAQIQNELNKATQARAGVPALEAAIEQARANLASQPVPDPKVLPDLRVKHQNCSAHLNTAKANLATANTAIGKIKAEAERLQHLKECPFCGTAGDGWQLKNAEALADQMAEQTGIATASQQIIDKCLTTIADLHSQATNQKNLEAAYADAKNTLATHESNYAQIQPVIARADALKAELERLPAEDPKLETAVQMLQTQINLKNQDIRTLEAELAAANTRAGEINRLAKAEQERDNAKLEVKQADCVEKELKALQAEMVAAAFGPILAHANALFDGILKTPLAYHNQEIGTFRDGIWVTHHTLSGTEKLLTYAAIQAALTSTSPCRVMILDELGRLDDRNIELLIVRLLRLTEEGKIDTVVGIDTGRADLYRAAQGTEGHALTVRHFN